MSFSIKALTSLSKLGDKSNETSIIRPHSHCTREEFDNAALGRNPLVSRSRKVSHLPFATPKITGLRLENFLMSNRDGDRSELSRSIPLAKRVSR